MPRRLAALDANATDLYLDSRGQIVGRLYDEAGNLRRSARIHLSQRQNPSWDFGGSTKVRGVNIGGWLVSEPWITPSLYDNTGDDRVIDEWTMGQYVSDACGRLDAHWASFYSQGDFYEIKGANLNFVRIPIGYWAIDNTHGYYCKGNQLDYLRQAVGWARNAGLKVLIDLHGAPGSQNGFDNSGKKGPTNWFTNPNYSTRAKQVVQTLANTFANDGDTVVCIELLNEPLTTTTNVPNALSFTDDYYNNAYYAVRYPSGSTPSNYAIAIHDGFQPLSYWADKFQPPNYQQVLLDTHIYSIFSPDQVAQSQSARMDSYCNMRGNIAESNKHLYTLVGEWTMAPTDCARYLNGRGVGARYDGSFAGSYHVGDCNGKTGDGSNFDGAYKAYLQNSFDTQRNVYEQGVGWIMWTWKTENAADWDYQRGLNLGYITRDLNSRGAVYC